METFRARIETRKNGAIGIFTWEIRNVQAEDINEAHNKIRAEISSEDKETRGFSIRSLKSPADDSVLLHEAMIINQ